MAQVSWEGGFNRVHVTRFFFSGARSHLPAAEPPRIRQDQRCGASKSPAASIYQNALASERLPVHLIYYSNGAGVDLNEFSQKDLSRLVCWSHAHTFGILWKRCLVYGESLSITNLQPESRLSLDQRAGVSNTLEYTARFICGSITAEDGPLRPGRYNSDINIFNRQNFPISFFWKATLNGDTRDHNYRIQNLDSSRSTSIDCKQILASIPQLANVSSERYFERVLTISVDLDPSIRSAISSSKGGIAGVISGSEAT